MNTRIEGILSRIQGPDVLDIGCCGGEGASMNSTEWLHKHIVEMWPDAWGIDFSADRIEVMRDLGYANIHVADAQNFALGKHFDTVIAGELIEHVENPAAFFRSVASHLKPNGRLVLTTPFPFALANTAYALLKFPKTCSNGEHVAWFCPATLTALARRLNFEVEHWELLDDYRSGVPSLRYRLGRVVVRFLPRRLRSNAMLFIIRKQAE